MDGYGNYENVIGPGPAVLRGSLPLEIEGEEIMAFTDRRAVLGALAAGGLLGGAPAFAADSNTYVGTWSGTLMGRLRVRLVIRSGTAASLYSIDQGGNEIAATAMAITPAGLHMDFANIHGSYDGKLDGDTIKGTWTQGQATPLDFTRGDAFKDVTPVKIEALTPADLDKARIDHGLPGVAAAFAKAGGTATIWAAGLRSAQATTPVAVDDIWHLGSNTKSMTATLVARLVEKGGITWDTTVGDVLGPKVPDMNPAYKPVTFRHLCSHHAGLQPNIEVADLMRFPRDDGGDPRPDRLRYAALALKQAPVAAPGEKMVYANNGFIVAGAMLEAVYDRSWEDLITAHVFTPLKLASAGFGPPGTPGKLDQPVGHVGAVPYPPGPGKIADNPVALGPAGRVHMNLRDLSAYLDAHLRQPAGFLKPESWKILHTPPFEGTYAMGWIVQGGRLWHNGSNTLWYAEMCVDPVKGVVAAVACNQGDLSQSQSAVDALLKSDLLRAAV